MTTEPEIARLNACGIVPVVVIDDVDVAVPLARALLAGGVDVIEITQPDADAAIIAQSVASQLERRISHKRAMKQSALKAMRAGAQGIKIVASGRLGGSDMARRDKVIMGRVPRQTLRADIDYAHHEALTTYSKIGVKVWVYRGEVLPGEEPLGAKESDFAS